MAKMKYWNGTAWEILDAKDTDTIDGKHASATLNTTEKSDLAGAINEVKSTVDSHSADVMPHQSELNVYVDTNSLDANGIYTVVNFKRADGTLYMRSTLSGGTSPNYTTDTWQFYDAAGTTVIATKTWTLTYDADGNIVTKVVA